VNWFATDGREPFSQQRQKKRYPMKICHFKFARLAVAVAALWGASNVTTHGQELPEFEAVGASGEKTALEGKSVIRVVKDKAIKADDEPTFAKLVGTNFANGTIEVKVFSKLLKDAPEHARGFIGVAFRINENNTRFEAIYVRPQNAMAENQLRRNRSIQYFSYPDFKFDRLRKEAAGEYESYAEMALEEWIDLRIVVKGSQAKLFVNRQKEPALIVNDLKHGPNSKGAVGLFVDIGTEGFFSDVKIHGE
jgi:hypothetical protein